jgi:hypothetical protein
MVGGLVQSSDDGPSEDFVVIVSARPDRRRESAVLVDFPGTQVPVLYWISW